MEKIMHNRVSIEDLKGVVSVTNPVVFVVVNRFEEEDGEKVLAVFANIQDALDYAEMEADINEYDEYVVLTQELIQ
jgi:hypothetical protein